MGFTTPFDTFTGEYEADNVFIQATLFGIQKGETKYSIKLLPFGGNRFQ